MLPPSEHAPSCIGMCACFNTFVCLSCLVFTVCTCLIPWSVAFNPGKSSIFCWRAEIQQRKLSLFVQVTRPVNATAAYHQWRLAESLIPAQIRSERPSAVGTALLSPTRYLTLIHSTENVPPSQPPQSLITRAWKATSLKMQIFFSVVKVCKHWLVEEQYVWRRVATQIST